VRPCGLGKDGGTATSGRFEPAAGANSVLFPDVRPSWRPPARRPGPSTCYIPSLYSRPFNGGLTAMSGENTAQAGNRLSAAGCVFREAVVECKMFRSLLESIKVGGVHAPLGVSRSPDCVKIDSLPQPSPGNDRRFYEERGGRG
jgi:hypothetical protein